MFQTTNQLLYCNKLRIGWHEVEGGWVSVGSLQGVRSPLKPDKPYPCLTSCVLYMRMYMCNYLYLFVFVCVFVCAFVCVFVYVHILKKYYKVYYTVI
jgi:hypothetical protein